MDKLLSRACLAMKQNEQNIWNLKCAIGYTAGLSESRSRGRRHDGLTRKFAGHANTVGTNLKLGILVMSF